MTAHTVTNRRTAADTMMALGGRGAQTYPPSWKIGQMHRLGARFLHEHQRCDTHGSRQPNRCCAGATVLWSRNDSLRSPVCPCAPSPNAAGGTVPPSKAEIARLRAADWPAVRDVVARPELQVIVSNVTEAGFRLDATYPARLTDLLYTRFARLPDGPPVFVIPTELVDDNGRHLAAMVDRLADDLERGVEFRDWLRARVRFCASLADRITTGTPSRGVIRSAS